LEVEFTMEITVPLPEDIATSIAPDAVALERAVIESHAIEGARSGRISRGQARRLLGLRTRYEVDGFLKKHGIPLEYSIETVLDDSSRIEAARTR
jgi:predicted HTH domain antitoxin